MQSIKPQNWMKLSCHDDKGNNVDILELTNVSADYIKGIYCTLYDPINERTGNYVSQEQYNLVFCKNNCLSLRSNLPLGGCSDLNNVVMWRNFNSVFTKEHIMNIVDEAHKLNTTNESSKCNIQWDKFVKHHLNVHIQNPTKRYVVFMRINCYDSIFQFDSIDFLSGIEFVRAWTQSNPMWPIIGNPRLQTDWKFLPLHTRRMMENDYLNPKGHCHEIKTICVFDSWKICKMPVVYESLQNLQKTKDDFTHVSNYLNVHLPKVIVTLIINLFFKCYENECSVSCIENHCYIHQRQNKVLLKFEQCIPKQIELIC